VAGYLKTQGLPWASLPVETVRFTADPGATLVPAAGSWPMPWTLGTVTEVTTTGAGAGIATAGLVPAAMATLVLTGALPPVKVNSSPEAAWNSTSNPPAALTVIADPSFRKPRPSAQPECLPRQLRRCAAALIPH
jgi:hypothetical protein